MSNEMKPATAFGALSGSCAGYARMDGSGPERTRENARARRAGRLSLLSLESLLLATAASLLFAAPYLAHAQQTPDEPDVEQAAPESELDEAIEQDDQDAKAADERDERRRRSHRRGRDESVIVLVGEDAHLPRGQSAEVVVSVFGSAAAEGEVRDSVVAVLGDARATGGVGQSVIAVLGNVYVDEHVGDQVVAIMGDLTLGPNAQVDGEAIAVGGRVHRDPNAQVYGGVREVGFAEGLVKAQGLRAWVEHCLLYGRLLAIEPHLGWAWGVAFAFLAFYVVLAMLFGDALNQCVRTLETKPAESVLAAFLSVILTPVLFMLLLITGIGILLMPFLGLALFGASLFGKAVFFGWMGRRVSPAFGETTFAQAALPVLIGGLIAMGVYMIPVVGIIAYKVMGILGLGVVLYTFILALQSRRTARRPSPAPVTSAAPASSPDAESAGVAAAAEGGESKAEGGAPSAGATPAPAPSVAVAAPRAGFWIRMGALLLDVILVTIVVGVLDGTGEFWFIALAGYGALMWKLKGTTVGGIVCNLQVVRLDGGEIGWDTAIVRALGCILSLVVAGLGFIWIAFDPERQAWHDKIAGTVVVRTQRAPAAVAAP